MLILCLAFLGPAMVLTKVATQLKFCPAMWDDLISLILASFAAFLLFPFIVAILMGVKCYLSVVLATSDVRIFSCHHWLFVYLIWRNVNWNNLLIFKWVCLSIFASNNYFHILGTGPFLMDDLQIFLILYIAFPFSLMVSFITQKFLFLIRFNRHFFFFLLVFWYFIWDTIDKPKVTEIYIYVFFCSFRSHRHVGLWSISSLLLNMVWGNGPALFFHMWKPSCPRTIW